MKSEKLPLPRDTLVVRIELTADEADRLQALVGHSAGCENLYEVLLPWKTGRYCVYMNGNPLHNSQVLVISTVR